MKAPLLRLAPLVLVLLAVSCADSKAVNAAFSQTKVSWFVFDTDQPPGLRVLSGFEQAQKVVWLPRNRAVYATDLAASPGGAAAAVSGLGVLLLDDSDGTLVAVRPGAQLPLTAYRTGRLFTWSGKLFVTLYQEPPAVLPPATLAWWAPGQSRLAFYPVPSQLRDPSRQAIEAMVPGTGPTVVFTWKGQSGAGWVTEQGAFNLADGSEMEAPAVVPEPVAPGFDAVRARMAERLGTGVPVRTLTAPGVVAVFTDTGWVAVGHEGEGRARLYRLPDLGTAGRYTGGVALKRGFVFSWETSFRGYSGAAGLVHVPFAVLAP